MATTYLRRNPSGSGNQRKFTFSFWVKKNPLNPASTYSLFDCGTSSNYFHIYFPDTHTLTVKSRISNSTAMELVTTRVFRDSAWYNIIVAVDSEQNTAADRCKIYVNGVQETAFNTANYGSQNLDHEIQDAGTYHVIGTNYAVSADEFFDGSMSYVAFVDGTQEVPGIFGETDSTTGQWKIKTTITPSVGWGTNGFLILVNGNSVTDQSGKGNDFTVAAGTLTKTEDCPSNNYPTVNINVGKATEYLNSTGLRFGNTEINQTGNPGVFISTLANTTGKYYWEMFVETVGYTTLGVTTYEAILQNGAVTYLYTPAAGYGYVYTGNKGNNNSQVSYGNSYTSGDYISVAFDQTNGSIWFAKNGVWQNNATTAEIGAGTTTYAAYSSMPTNGKFYAPAFGLDNSAVTRINFGNGTFGTTTLSTTYSPTVGDTGAKFKYNIIPTGFTAVSTKGYNA